MAEEEFINFPVKNHCSTVFSLGDPGSGKTWLMLKCFEQWRQQGMFKKAVLILPSFRNEQDQQYKGLDQYDNVFVYEKYRDNIVLDLIEESAKDAELVKAQKLTNKDRPNYLFIMDDATSEEHLLDRNPVVKKLATESRHLHIHTWFAIHHYSVLKPAVRNQVNFMVFYNMHISALKQCWEKFINFSEFRRFKDFLEFWDNQVLNQDHGCIMTLKNKWYCPSVAEW